MSNPKVIIVGAGPAGIRAAQTLLAAGVRPIVIDENATAGGQIYRRQPAQFQRDYQTLYGFDAAKAAAIHADFDALKSRIDYQPNTLAWHVHDGVLFTASGKHSRKQAFDALILATGATDRLLPIKGWTLPGCYSVGAAQIALKAQACAIGRRVVFVGTGPLLYLVSYQYAKAGINVAAVLDTAAFSGQLRALTSLAARPTMLLKGLYYRAQLLLRNVPIFNSVEPLEVIGTDAVRGIRFRDQNKQQQRLDCDAVGMGFHLRSETQLADLARCTFRFDAELGAWIPETDADGRSSSKGVYLAGDGHRILGADAAEIAGALVAGAVLTDLGFATDAAQLQTLRHQLARMDRFRQGLAQAFPWPATLARDVADDVVLCRCEAITAGELRRAATALNAPELNRAKALVRVGMGRCQGRYCGAAAAEVLAAARGIDIAAAGRLRGQGPVKPLPLDLTPEEST